MGELEDFVGCKINNYLTNTTLNIYQPDIINKMNKGFNEFMNFNTPSTPHKGIVSNQETDTKNINIYIRDTGLA